MLNLNQKIYLTKDRIIQISNLYKSKNNKEF